MKNSFTEKQSIGFLKEAEASMPVKELCRKHGFSDASFHTWRPKLGGIEVSEAHRLKENARLKKRLAEAMPDMEALRIVVKGKPETASQTRGSGGDSPHKIRQTRSSGHGCEMRPLPNGEKFGHFRALVLAAQRPLSSA